nr:PREDICTED: endoplasmic reticulum aminopeptidase 1-like [Latimeria chalumnae]|eukprot:XP_014340352.1 PREDICTED: endoplasmic reticulum aminopeptidase 1-like [Latimeria chalumnae]
MVLNTALIFHQSEYWEWEHVAGTREEWESSLQEEAAVKRQHHLFVTSLHHSDSLSVRVNVGTRTLLASPKKPYLNRTEEANLVCLDIKEINVHLRGSLVQCPAAMHVGTVLLLMAAIGGSLYQRGKSQQATERDISIPSGHSGRLFPWQSSRLPTNVTPEHYHLTLHPDFHTQAFRGWTKILLYVHKATSSIVLNSKELHITGARLEQLPKSNQQKNLILQTLQSLKNEQVAFVASETLEAGRRYELAIEYSAVLASGFLGFYKASYRTLNGETRMLAATQFEPTSARKAFPCFDEPSFKSTFTLTIIRDRKHNAISNMPKRVSIERKDGLVEDHFLHSVKMSTYLVAFVVSDFVSINSTSARGTKNNNSPNVAIYATKLHYILHLPPKRQFYFNLVAIPDFEAGAMENWGLITFRKTALLYDPRTSTLQDKLWVTMVITHELAHQWFGNLVTMEWWNDIWLNEGFATYMEYFACEHLAPSWSVEDEMLLFSFYKALGRDAFRSSHPVSVPVKGSQHIREMFDVVSYSKGASILRMLKTFLTEPLFSSGVKSYLKKHSYGNAHKDHLWEALTQSALAAGCRINVKAMMDTWTVQKGYPLVSVRVNGAKLKVTQEIFTLYPQNSTGFLWQIPFTYYTSNSSTTTTHLLKQREESITIPHPVIWIKANSNSTGFYRVNYDAPTFNALQKQLEDNHSVFSRSDRASLIDDTFYLASHGTLSFKSPLSLTLYLRHETEYLPIRLALHHIFKLVSRFVFADDLCTAKLIKKHILVLFGNLMRIQRWNDSGTLPQQNLRILLLSLATGFQNLPAERRAWRLFQRWMETDGKAQLPNSLRNLIFRTGIRKGNNKHWRFLLTKYFESGSSADKIHILSALAQTRNAAKKIWLLKAALRNRQIKSQDLLIIIWQVSSSPRGSELAWKFMKQHWSKLVKEYSLGSSYLSQIVLTITSRFDSKRKYNKVRKFFQAQKETADLTFVKQALENIQVNIRWLKKNKEEIQRWMQERYPKEYVEEWHCRHKAQRTGAV